MGSSEYSVQLGRWVIGRLPSAFMERWDLDYLIATTSLRESNPQPVSAGITSIKSRFQGVYWAVCSFISCCMHGFIIRSELIRRNSWIHADKYEWTGACDNYFVPSILHNCLSPSGSCRTGDIGRKMEYKSHDRHRTDTQRQTTIVTLTYTQMGNLDSPMNLHVGNSNMQIHFK